MLKVIRGSLWVVLPVLALAAYSSARAEDAPAQAMKQMGQQIAGLGGAMHAMAGFCGGYSLAELAELKRQQKQQAMVMGFSAREFDQAFESGKAKTEARWDTASSQQQRSACLDLEKQLGGKGR